MSFKAKRFGHTDGNHKQIADALRKCGYSVGETSGATGFFDLVICDGKSSVFVEIKTTDKGARFTAQQLENISKWKGLVAFVSSVDEALNVMRQPEKYCLTPLEKNHLFNYCFRKRRLSSASNPQILVSAFEKEFLQVVRAK